MKNLRIWTLLVILLAGTAILTGCKAKTEAEALPHSLPTAPASDDRVKAIDAALQEMAKNRQDVMAFIINDVAIDRVNFSTDGSLALVWMTLIDRESKQTVVGETGLAVAIKSDSAPHGWVIILQQDQNWSETLARVPEDMLDPEIRTFYTHQEQQESKVPPISGYRLPWEAGTRKRITGSIGHVFTYRTCPDTCLYAFDFADGTNFRVMAARGGRVKTAIWRYPNNFHEHANYLLLEDTTNHLPDLLSPGPGQHTRGLTSAGSGSPARSVHWIGRQYRSQFRISLAFYGAYLCWRLLGEIGRYHVRRCHR
jgi:hypothetical protein